MPGRRIARGSTAKAQGGTAVRRPRKRPGNSHFHTGGVYMLITPPCLISGRRLPAAAAAAPAAPPAGPRPPSRPSRRRPRGENKHLPDTSISATQPRSLTVNFTCKHRAAHRPRPRSGAEEEGRPHRTQRTDAKGAKVDGRRALSLFERLLEGFCFFIFIALRFCDSDGGASSHRERRKRILCSARKQRDLRRR